MSVRGNFSDSLVYQVCVGRMVLDAYSDPIEAERHAARLRSLGWNCYARRRGEADDGEQHRQHDQERT